MQQDTEEQSSKDSSKNIIKFGAVRAVLRKGKEHYFCPQSYQLKSPKVILSTQPYFLLFLDKFPQTKNRDYPSGLKPDLKSRKAFIYLSYYTLIYQPLTSIRPSQRVLRGIHSCQKLVT